MSNFNLAQLLNQYFPKDQAEVDCKNRMLQFLLKHPDCFERFLQVGHFTASAWLINRSGQKALLMHHKKLNNWLQLGGHADGDTDLLNVAIKEAIEESGIDDIAPVQTTIFDIDIHTIPANKKDPEHEHFDVRFLLRVQSGVDFLKNDESNELRWIDKSEASLPTTEASILRMFHKWCSL